MSSGSLWQSRDLLFSAKEAGKTTTEGVEMGNMKLSHEQWLRCSLLKLLPSTNTGATFTTEQNHYELPSSCSGDPPVSVPTCSPEGCLRWTLLPGSQDAQLRKIKMHNACKFSYVITDGISSPTWGNCLEFVPEHLKFSLEISNANPLLVHWRYLY